MASRAAKKKRKRQQRERMIAHMTETTERLQAAADAAAEHPEDPDKQREAAIEAFKTGKTREPTPNPYVWQGNILVHRKDGRTVAHAGEFPGLHRAREHHRRLSVMHAFHRGEPPYFREDTNPKIEVAHV